MPQPGASWEDHLVRILSESLPNGASRERSMPQPDAPWEDYLVRILEESLPDGVPRVIQQIQKFQKNTTQKTTKNHLSQPVQIIPPGKGSLPDEIPHSSKHLSPSCSDPLTLQPSSKYAPSPSGH
jgi:hypothetical protein